MTGYRNLTPDVAVALADLIGVIEDAGLGGCEFSYGRVTESVGARGRAEHAEELFAARGNIQPAPGKERELLEDEDRLKDAILIFTSAELTAGRGRVKADRVYWRGAAYRVALVEPWRDQGGFTKALAVLEREASDD